MNEKNDNPPNRLLNTLEKISIPRIITKKELAIIFKIWKSTGSHGKVLRKKYFDDVALEHLEMTLEEYNDKKWFNRFETPKIIAYFNITAEELKEI